MLKSIEAVSLGMSCVKVSSFPDISFSSFCRTLLIWGKHQHPACLETYITQQGWTQDLRKGGGGGAGSG